MPTLNIQFNFRSLFFLYVKWFVFTEEKNLILSEDSYLDSKSFLFSLIIVNEIQFKSRLSLKTKQKKTVCLIIRKYNLE